MTGDYQIIEEALGLLSDEDHGDLPETAAKARDALNRIKWDLDSLKISLAVANKNTREDVSLMNHAADTFKRATPEVRNIKSATRHLVEIAQRFCARVEAGEIRSKRTYAEFREALALPVVKPFLEDL